MATLFLESPKDSLIGATYSTCPVLTRKKRGIEVFEVSQKLNSRPIAKLSKFIALQRPASLIRALPNLSREIS